MSTLALFVSGDARAAWMECIRGTPIHMLSWEDIVPANRGRWTDIILVAGESVPVQENVFKVLAPETIRVILVSDNGPVRLDTANHGLALSLGFSAETILADGTVTTLSPVPTTGAAVIPAPGAPPVRWPGLLAHGFADLPVVDCPAHLQGVDLAIDRPDIWIEGAPFTLPSDTAPLWCPLPEDPRYGRLLSRSDFGPLFGLPALPHATRSLHRLLPLATVRALLRTVAPSLFLS